jgi:hypothetical protein
MQIYGIDLAMEKFDVSFLDGKGSEKHLIVNNKLGAITRFLKRVPTGSLLCAEHTGVYGNLLVFLCAELLSARLAPKIAGQKTRNRLVDCST